MVAIPQPTGTFPAPSGIFPPTAAQTAPQTFGLSPYSPENMYVPKLFDPNAGAASLSARAGAQSALFQQAQAVGIQNATGIDVSGASSWSPQEAANQTDAALAKLSTVNPQLAEQLAAQRTPGQDTGGGLFGAMKDIAGAVLHPALSVGGKVLDIVSRTANIIPNTVYDAIDGGDFNGLNDVGTALSGQVKHNWHSVLTQAGMPDSGPLNLVSTVLGFGGDIATDPLTYLIPGGGGVKAGEAASLVGEKAALHPDIVARAVEANLWGVGKEAQENAGEALLNHLRTIMGQVDIPGARAAGVNAEELMGRMAGVEKGVYDDAQLKILNDMFKLYNDGFNMTASRTLGAWLRKGGSIALSDGQSMSSAQVKALLEQTVKDGANTGRATSEWLQARAAASAMGGVRFKGVLPFTAMRYISPALPGTAGFSIENAARFFAGQSGMTRLVSAISDGKAGASFDDLTTWMQKGWTAAKDNNDQLVTAIRGRGINLGSGYYSLSEQVGRLTAHFGNAGVAARHGLAGYLGYQEQKRAEDAAAGFLERISGAVAGSDGKPQFLADQEAMGYSLRKGKTTASVEDSLRRARYLHYFPSGAPTGSAHEVEEWFLRDSVFREQALRDKVAAGDALSPAEDAALKRSDNILADMQQVAAETPANEKAILSRYGEAEDLAREQAAVYEVNVGNVKMRLGDATALHPGQVRSWQAGAVHEGVTDKTWYIHADTPEAKARLEQNGVDETLRTYGDRDYGVHVTDKRQSPDDIEVAIKGQYTPLDENGDAMLAGPEHTVHGEYERGKDAVDSAAAAAGQLPADKLAYDRNVAEAATAGYVAYTPDAGFVRTLEDGSHEATVFDHHNVMQVSEDAQWVQEGQGYFHFTFNDKTVKSLRGEFGQDDTKILLKAPNIQAELSRKTRGLTLDEANGEARKYLIDKFKLDEASLPEWVLETDPLKSHLDYVGKMGEGIQDKLLGRAGRRFSLLGDLGPHMFGGAIPRRQEFEWALNPALVNAYNALDKESQAAAQRVLRSNKLLLDAQHAAHQDTSDAMGLLLTTADEAGIPDRLSQLVVKHRDLLDGAQRNVEEGQKLVNDRTAELDAEEAEYKATRDRTVNDLLANVEGAETPASDRVVADASGKQWHVPKDAVPPDGVTWEQLDEAAGDNPEIQRVVQSPPHGPDDTVAVFHGGPAPLKGDPAAVGGGAVGRAFYVTTSAETANFYSVASYYGRGKKVAEVIEGKVEPFNEGANVTPGALNVKNDELFHHMTGVSDADIEKFKKLKAPTPDQQVKLELFVRRLEALRARAAAEGEATYAGELRGENVWYKLSDIFKGDDAANIALGKVGYKGHHYWLPDAPVSAKFPDAGYAGGSGENMVHAIGLFNPDDSFVGFHNLEHAEAKTVDAETLARSFDRSAKNGDVFLNSKTGEVLTRDGALVKRGGGRKLRGLDEIGAERDRLGQQLADLEKEAEALKARPESQVLSGSKTAHKVARASESAAKQRAAERATSKKIGEMLGRLQMRVSNDMNEANRTLAEAKQLRAKLTPALHKVDTVGGLEGMTVLHIPGMEGTAMPAFIADQWHSIYDRHGPGYLTAQWRKTVIGPWKRWATFRNPGFHVRNFFGAWFNTFLMGGTSEHYEFSRFVNMARWGKGDYYDTAVADKWFDELHLGRIFGDSQKGQVTYGNISEFLANHGIGRANTASVMGAKDSIDMASEVMDDVKKSGSPGFLRRNGRRYDNAMRSVGSGVEDLHRTAAWAVGMATNQGDPYAARALTMLAHGDYADLSNTEDHLRDLIPFYKWMRTNVPYQIRALAENPSQVTMISGKLKASAYDLAGVDQAEAEAGQLDWMKETLTLPIPKWMPFIGSKDGKDGLKYATMDLPYADLYNGLNDYMSSFLPVAKNAIEAYGLHQAVFSGKPLTGRMEPLSGVFNLPGVRDVLSAAGVASKGADGQLYVDDKLQNVMMAFPLYARFRNFLEADPSRVQNRVGTFTSMLAGIGVRAEDTTSAELDFYYNDVEPVLQAYRDMGVQFPALDDFRAPSVTAATGGTEGVGIQTAAPESGVLSAAAPAKPATAATAT